MIEHKSKKLVIITTVVALVIICGVAFATWFFVIKDRGATKVEVTRIAFKPENFVKPLDLTNEYQPLTPGMQLIRVGTTEVGSRKVPHQIISTVTDVVRTINGVQAIAVLDQSEDSGEIAQVGIDYLAIDRERNIWLLGGYAEDYEKGQYTNVDSAFIGTSTGAQVGILIPAVVTKDTPRWFIGSSGPTEEPSVAEPVSASQNLKVAYGEFRNVRAVVEGAATAIDNEIKYYAPGVGVIRNVPKDKSLHQDDFELANIVQLSPEGLAEASQVVLDLEEHAKKVAPHVYGNVPKAQRLMTMPTTTKK